jgi:3-deoxy-manno-octulosonate cytidylyltransferase (CMP-KDO synthetase)
MRVLEYGMRVRMIPTKHQTHAVDTVEDLNKVEKLMKD